MTIFNPFSNERPMKHRKPLRTFTIAWLLILSLGFASCSPVTKPNYDKIQTGMKLSEVEAVLGKQHQQMSAAADIGKKTIAQLP